VQHLQVAQQQIYNDAPYIWLFGNELPLLQGTYAYKHSVIGGFWADPALEGVTDIPIPNTIYPASG